MRPPDVTVTDGTVGKSASFRSFPPSPHHSPPSCRGGAEGGTAFELAGSEFGMEEGRVGGREGANVMGTASSSA